MKLVLNDAREFKVVNKAISMAKDQPLLFRVIMSKYNKEIRKGAAEKYGTKFKAISNGGDTIPYVIAMFNTLSDCAQVSDRTKFLDAISSVERISNDFENAYRRWYHED